jgi:hypothetical protein
MVQILLFRSCGEFCSTANLFVIERNACIQTVFDDQWAPVLLKKQKNHTRLDYDALSCCRFCLIWKSISEVSKLELSTKLRPSQPRRLKMPESNDDVCSSFDTYFIGWGLRHVCYWVGSSARTSFGGICETYVIGWVGGFDKHSVPVHPPFLRQSYYRIRAATSQVKIASIWYVALHLAPVNKLPARVLAAPCYSRTPRFVYEQRCWRRGCRAKALAHCWI